ncbi:uncharacterized protein [Arachis hypogaea]|uniref:uncharacterized protein n=1 Tax=Arachis hypogaea TaxID=3818 RepID=UPI003B21C004
MQSLQSNHAKELKMRESLEASCITLRRENENMAKRYMESLNNLDDQALFSFSQALLSTQCRFKNLTKQEGSSQMLNLLLPPNFLEIRTKLQTWLIKLLCQSFQGI